MLVHMWMTENPDTAERTDTVAEALTRMKQGQFRRLPVMEGVKLSGIVTLFQLQEAVAAGKETSPIGDIMTADPLTVNREDLIDDVASRMRGEKVGAFPVMDEDKLVGIVTESDLFKALMVLMGTDVPGAHLIFELDVEMSELSAILELVRVYRLETISLTSCKVPGTNRKLVSLRLQGDRIEKFLTTIQTKPFRLLKADLDGQSLLA